MESRRGRGDTILFWFDRWALKTRLSDYFPQLFEVCQKKYGSISDFSSNNEIGWHFSWRVKDKDDGKLTSTDSPTHLVHPPRAWTGKNDPETMVEEDERADSFDSPPSIENRRRNTCRNNSVSSRSSSLQSTSRSVSDAEEDVEEKGVLDDWEEIADALSEDHRGGDDRNRHRRRYCDRALASVEPASSPAIRSDATRARRTIKQERVLSSRRAWRLENSSHPPLLNVPKKCSCPLIKCRPTFRKSSETSYALFKTIYLPFFWDFQQIQQVEHQMTSNTNMLKETTERNGLV
ncbi:hypothetical protein Cni_G02674 [Canna indica]|uniref:Uncharacterized protein n=1 Tax=Canna indica TaxID=4628 RepID=A0AAQ3JR97_9LILI|nr:hypothetical protein Cni_G02674 [Canna indica]